MTLATALTVALLLPTLTDDPERPPRLTFEKHVDYIAWVNDLVGKDKPKNALDLYEGFFPVAASGGVPKLEGSARDQFANCRRRVWNAGDYPELAAYIKKCSPYLDILEKAAKQKDFWLPIPTDVEMLLLREEPALSCSRDACRALLARAWMEKDQQAEALTHAHRVILRHADHMQQTSMTLANLTGMAERALLYESLVGALHEEVIKPNMALSTYHSIYEYDPRSIDWPRIVLLEWTVRLNAVQYLCPGGEHDIDRWKRYLGDNFSGSPNEVALVKASDPGKAVEAFDRHYNGLLSTVEGSPHLRKAEDIRQITDKTRREYDSNGYVGTLLGRLSRAYALSVRTESQRRGTLLTLAILAHQAKHGDWPKSLKKIDEKLGFKGLKTLRRDPFTGKPFKYELKDGHPLLYSVGHDGKDDGGQHDWRWGESDGGGDFVFWPYQRP